jgi:hypothetical protein
MSRNMKLREGWKFSELAIRIDRVSQTQLVNVLFYLQGVA